MEQPLIYTEQLCLRPFRLDDAAEVAKFAGHIDIAKNTMMPHPYDVKDAIAWISTHKQQLKEGNSLIYAITLRKTEQLVGSIGLNFREEHQLAELGYWIAKPYWGKGYATDAVALLIKHGFEKLKLNRVYSKIYSVNEASLSVLVKNKMILEGTLRQHVKRFDTLHDVFVYGILRSEYVKK